MLISMTFLLSCPFPALVPVTTKPGEIQALKLLEALLLLPVQQVLDVLQVLQYIQYLQCCHTQVQGGGRP